MSTTDQQPASTTSAGEEAVVVDNAPLYAMQSESQHDTVQHERSTTRTVNMKFLNGTSFLLTAMLSTGTIFFHVTDGVYGDDYMWMKYQTLFTPNGYTSAIWMIIFALHGCFIYASCFDKELQRSPLVGYSYLVNSDLTSEAAKSTIQSSVAVNYPGVCATLLMMLYSYDCGSMGFSFFCSVLCCTVLLNILKIQEMASKLLVDDTAGNSAAAAADNATDDVKSDYVKQQDENGLDVSNQLPADESGKIFTRENVMTYTCLILPFELTLGYVLPLCVLYLNTWFDSTMTSLSTTFHLVLANLSLVGTLVAGFMVLWKTERKYFGVGIALAWYLLGVATELHNPTQPIYNEFSDKEILFTQVVAYLATTVLMTVLCVRLMKSAININMFNCVGKLTGGCHDDTGTEDITDDNIITDYVHA